MKPNWRQPKRQLLERFFKKEDGDRFIARLFEEGYKIEETIDSDVYQPEPPRTLLG